MTATTAQSYRKLLRHLKSLPTPPQNSYFFNLVGNLSVLHCFSLKILRYNKLGIPPPQLAPEYSNRMQQHAQVLQN